MQWIGAGCIGMVWGWFTCMVTRGQPGSTTSPAWITLTTSLLMIETAVMTSWGPGLLFLGAFIPGFLIQKALRQEIAGIVRRRDHT